jgi:hypothetical protein
MFQLGKTIISEEVIEKKFVCNLNACKGSCCVQGDAGAPLDEKETKILTDIYPKLKSYLRKEGILSIKEQGAFTTSKDGDYETPLINGGDCAYVIFDEKNIALCAIEEAYNQGDISFIKPISCHLYPVRVKDYSQFAAVNYHQWEICDDACILGKQMQVPVYKFVKQALIRKFGEKWYSQLEEFAQKHLKR